MLLTPQLAVTAYALTSSSPTLVGDSNLQALGSMGFLDQVCSLMPVEYCSVQSVKDLRGHKLPV